MSTRKSDLPVYFRFKQKNMKEDASNIYIYICVYVYILCIKGKQQITDRLSLLAGASLQNF